MTRGTESEGAEAAGGSPVLTAELGTSWMNPGKSQVCGSGEAQLSSSVIVGCQTMREVLHQRGREPHAGTDAAQNRGGDQSV